ncbi:hypothetical protein Sjap_012067 [Stephania japonica]|uniref:DUF7894 domain-containing protein n=1 Tax=Stephania japonica TaxID=461633 RepID=A0AAP0JEL3_9MAGN
MKVGSKLIFLFKDPNGVGPAIFAALQPNTNNFQPKQTSTPFELSLDKYGIRDLRASGDLHFIDHQALIVGGNSGNLDGFPKTSVTVLLMENYEPPVVACAINQVLQSIIEENSSSSMMPTLVLPFLVQASTFHNWDKNDSAAVSLYATHIGTQTDLVLSMVAALKKPPPSLQIHYEPLACLIHFARVLKFPTVFLIEPTHPPQRGDEYLEFISIAHNVASGVLVRTSVPSNVSMSSDSQQLHKIGDLLARNVDLCFRMDKIARNPVKAVKSAQEPWRELYG